LETRIVQPEEDVSYEESKIKADHIITTEDISAQIEIENVRNIVRNAREFGQKLMDEFAADNVALGITQDGMTKTVRQNMSEVMMALMSGSLYDAIDEAKAIPNECKDIKYITDERLLNYINKIEIYLGITLSESL